MAPYEHLLVKRDGDTVRITMDRPQRRNTLTEAHLRELLDAFEDAGRGDATGIVLAGSGPVFCAGHDFADVAARDLAGVRDLLQLCTRVMRTIESVPQVVIARVHAIATAAGCQLVASCDLAVAAESASFALPGGKAGWFCHTPAVPVARNIGRKRLMELALTGDPIDARTAAEWGLINQAVPAAQLQSATRRLAEQVAGASSLVVALGKQAFYTQIDLDQPKAYAYAKEVMSMNALAADAQEGIGAFLGKRAACWSGK